MTYLYKKFYADSINNPENTILLVDGNDSLQNIFDDDLSIEATIILTIFLDDYPNSLSVDKVLGKIEDLFNLRLPDDIDINALLLSLEKKKLLIEDNTNDFKHKHYHCTSLALELREQILSGYDKQKR